MDLQTDRRTFAEELRAWLRHQSDEMRGFRADTSAGIEGAVLLEKRLLAFLFGAGWTRWGWPKDFGGLGGDPVLRGVLVEEIYAAGFVFPAEVYALFNIVAPALVEFAPELARAHIPSLLKGNEVWSQGFSEPDAGSDLASLRTRAIQDGDTYVLSGQKVWSSSAHISDWSFLLARTGTAEARHRGLTMFWVPMTSPGLTVRPIACANGRNEMSEIFLDDVVVPSSQVVGMPGQGWAVAMYALQYERGSYGWQRQAWLRARLEESLKEGSDSRGSYGSGLVGDAYLKWLALRSSCLETFQLLASGTSLGSRSSIDKVLLSTADQAILDAARELLWPTMELSDADNARAWRRDWFYSRVTSIYGGAVEVQRDIVADLVAGLPKAT